MDGASPTDIFRSVIESNDNGYRTSPEVFCNPKFTITEVFFSDILIGWDILFYITDEIRSFPGDDSDPPGIAGFIKRKRHDLNLAIDDLFQFNIDSNLEYEGEYDDYIIFTILITK